MTNIAWKNLSREKTRLAISVGGVAFAVLLILILRGLYAGISNRATQYIRSVRADLWVAQAGTPGDFLHSLSLLPEQSKKQIEAIPGVKEAVPLVSLPLVFKLRGKDVDFRLMGFDPASGIGGPPAVEQGRKTPRTGELIVDRVFASNHNLRLGDVIAVRGYDFRIAGVASGGNAVISQYAWATLPDVVRFLGVAGVVNYFVVRTSGTPAAVAERIRRQVSGTEVFTEKEFEDKNTEDLREGFLPILWVLVVIALIIGIAVIGLTIYTATIEKAREYGVLKAIGFSNRKLYRIVYQQSLTAGVAGFAVGTILTFALAAALQRLIPSFATTIGPIDVGLAAAAALLMSLLSSFVPVRPIARLDPASVFRV